MLSLRRFPGESVIIVDDDKLEVVVHDFDSKFVTLIIQSLPGRDQAYVETLMTNGEFVMIFPDVYVRARWRKPASYIDLDFDAPHSIKIDREEIHLKKTGGAMRCPP
jgi:sRNA-binding carbon storage regulator CsrA